MKINFVILLFSSVLFVAGCSLDGTYDPRIGNPSVPGSPVPVDNASDQETILQLEWYSEGAEKYTVYFDSKNPPEKILLADTLTRTAFVFGLDYATTYYWQVVSILKDGSKSESDIWNFSTMPKFTATDGTVLDNLYWEINEPSNIDIMYQTWDRSGGGIPNYSKNNFEFFENENLVLDPANDIKFKKKENINYLLKTILLIDNTGNPNFDYSVLKSAAVNFVSNLSEDQQVEIYSFSDEVVRMQEFTSNTGLLTAAITNISPGGAQTNLFGALIHASEQLEENFSLENVEQTSIVLFTYNNDKKEEFSLEDAINGIIDQNIYAVGIGNDLNPGVFSLLGNREYYIIERIEDLDEKFSGIQSSLNAFTNSFHWINYNSPERDDVFNRFKIFVKNNPYAGSGAVIEVRYNSKDFYSTGKGLFINASPTKPSGIDSLSLFSGLKRTLTASTFHEDEPPFYTWFIGDSSVVKLDLLFNENNRADVTALETAGSTTILIVTDLNNGLQKVLPISIE